ncbi:hypothetical protein EYF80_019246 [Liparis tanakae]|uniref:Uncharacterized protein n=1 Tax=Liparis tanakae TaxID=230148 RepID=A0A4Z2HY64_9TELE|nr:hypothetical protein EYF80_019246 [Liparis tanakae]
MQKISDVPDQQGCVGGENEAVSSAAVQDRVPGDLQRQLGLEVLIGQTVGALRPPVAEQPLSEEVKRACCPDQLVTRGDFPKNNVQGVNWASSAPPHWLSRGRFMDNKGTEGS